MIKCELWRATSKTDKVAIKANALHEINLKKQRLLIELEQLKNGNKI